MKITKYIQNYFRDCFLQNSIPKITIFNDINFYFIYIFIEYFFLINSNVKFISPTYSYRWFFVYFIERFVESS